MERKGMGSFFSSGLFQASFLLLLMQSAVGKEITGLNWRYEGTVGGVNIVKPGFQRESSWGYDVEFFDEETGQRIAWLADKQLIEQNIGLVRSSHNGRMKDTKDSNKIKLDASMTLFHSKQEE